MDNNKPQMQGALFDLDGVLIDTEQQYTSFWSHIGEEYNAKADDFAEKIKGSNLASILNTYFPEESSQQEIVNKLNDFQANMQYNLYPGVKEFILALENAGIPKCIVTSSDNLKMESLFRKQPFLKEHFPMIITGDQVSKGKPHPECYLKGAELIGRNIKDCTVFEDSLSGIKAGLASGAKTVALSTSLPLDTLLGLTKAVIPGFLGLTPADIAALTQG